MFTVVDTAIGALLLHQATTTLLFNNGTILGVSGLLRTCMRSRSLTSVLFFLGMALSYPTMKSIAPEILPEYPIERWDQGSIIFTLGTSILVGWGTQACGGCTSGHMLCGLSRLSSRSLLATAIFFVTAVATFQLLHPSLSTTACLSNNPCYQIAPSLVLATKPLYLLLSLNAFAIEIVPHLLPTYTSRRTGYQATYLLSGYTFGLGLVVSGMASPAKVSAFFAFSLFPLDLTRWDPSLAMVILFGILPNMARIRWRGLTRAPKFESAFSMPTKKIGDVDWKFLFGAAAFGVGWGASGVCPGPAFLRAVAQPAWGLLWLSGFWVGGLV